MYSDDSEYDLFTSFRADLYCNDKRRQVSAAHSLERVAADLRKQDVEHKLIPLLGNLLSRKCLEPEVCLILSGQIEKLLPFVGGSEEGHLLFGILEKLTEIPDTHIRERIISVLQTIGRHLDSKCFLEFVFKLVECNVVSCVCAASLLFPVSYVRVPKSLKADLRALYKNLCDEENWIIRLTYGQNLNQFLKSLEPEHIKGDFLQVFAHFVHDEKAEIRNCAVDIGIEIMSKVHSKAIQEYVLHLLLNASSDYSWQVRQHFALNITTIQHALGPEKTQKSLVNTVENLLKDRNVYVKEAMASNLVPFCCEIQKSFKCPKNQHVIHPIIVDKFLPIIDELYNSSEEDVKWELNAAFSSLAATIGKDLSKKYLLPMLIREMSKETKDLKEDINNLNCLLNSIDVDGDILILVENLLIDLESKFTIDCYAKRNLIKTLSILVKHIDQSHFDHKLKQLYLQFLNYENFGIRKIALMVLPLMIKKFGHRWMDMFVRENIFIKATDDNPSVRSLFLFALEEMLTPSLERHEQKDEATYLHNVKDYCLYGNDEHKQNAATILHVIRTRLEEAQLDYTKASTVYRKDSVDEFNLLSIEMLDDFMRDNEISLTPISEDEIEKCNTDTYIIGLLKFLPELYTVAYGLITDENHKVKSKAVSACNRILELMKNINEEMQHEWAKRTIGKITLIRN